MLGCNATQVMWVNQSYNGWRTWHIDNLEVFQILLVSVIFLLSVLGNLAVIAVVVRCSALRTTVNYFLVNLAVADLLFTLFCWPVIANRITSPMYVLGRAVCKLSVMVEVTSVTVSVLTLAAVACDRLYAVTMPIRARHATAFPAITITAIWVLSLAVALPYFYMRDLQVVQLVDFTLESCTDMAHLCTPATREAFWYYQLLMMLILFFVPGGVMVLAYTVIVWRLWCTRASPSHESQPPQHLRTRRKVVVMTAVVVAAFLLCWGPMYTIVLYNLTHTSDMSGSAMPSWVEHVLFWVYFLGYFNSALNPLLYGGFSDNFRQGFRTVFRSLCSRSGRGDEYRGTSASLPLCQPDHRTVSLRMSNSLSSSHRKMSRQPSLLNGSEGNGLLTGNGVVTKNGVC